MDHKQHRDVTATIDTHAKSSGNRIYMDYASTTPCDKRVVETMVKYMTEEGEFGNPASRSHSFGWKADDAVDEARKNVAELIGADPKEIVFTSGATEADNLAIKGIADFYQSNGKHIITSKIEHKAVLDPCRELERDGFEVTYLDPNEDGIVTAQMVIDAVRDDTILVSIMYINNEMGTINDIEGIGKYCFENKIMFHVDAAQATGKIEFNLQELPVHAMSLSAHKTYGPKGIGALYVRKKPRVRLRAQIHGGGHERGMRSGTLPTHQIVGMGEAFKYARLEMEKNKQHIKMLHDRLLSKLTTIEESYINGSLDHKVPNILNISFNFVEGESLIMALDNVAVSSGSACTSASLEPSYVLRAIGRDDELAHSSIRFSFGRTTTVEEVDSVAETMLDVIGKLRILSPLWDMYLDGVDFSKVKWNTH
jgi:cysteine desulfurase